MPELDHHRLLHIETGTLTSDYPRLVGKNARLGSHGAVISTPIVTLHTDQGATGWGILQHNDSNLARFVGQRVSDLIDPHSGAIDDARALDFALHDLAGVLLKQPVYALLGAGGALPVPTYDGAIYMDDLDPEDAPRGIAIVLQNCALDYELGYRAFKLKIGRGHRWSSPDTGLRQDIEVTRAVRAAYPDCAILVDANDGYTCDGFLDYLRAVVDCDLFWVEEPFPEQREDLRRLRAYLDQHSPRTLIADGEAHPDVPSLLELASDGLLDVLLMDTVGLGLSAWRRLMPRLRELGVQASPHAWGDPLKTLYTAHIAAGCGNVVTVEGVPGTIRSIDHTGYRLEAGMLHIPEVPGWGLQTGQ